LVPLRSLLVGATADEQALAGFWNTLDRPQESRLRCSLKSGKRCGAGACRGRLWGVGGLSHVSRHGAALHELSTRPPLLSTSSITGRRIRTAVQSGGFSGQLWILHEYWRRRVLLSHLTCRGWNPRRTTKRSGILPSQLGARTRRPKAVSTKEEEEFGAFVLRCDGASHTRHSYSTPMTHLGACLHGPETRPNLLSKNQRRHSHARNPANDSIQQMWPSGRS